MTEINPMRNISNPLIWLLFILLLFIGPLSTHANSWQKILTNFSYENYINSLPQPLGNLFTVNLIENSIEFAKCHETDKKLPHPSTFDCKTLMDSRDDEAVKQRIDSLKDIAADVPLVRLHKVAFSNPLLNLVSGKENQLYTLETKSINQRYVIDQLGEYFKSHNLTEISPSYDSYTGSRFTLRTAMTNVNFVCTGDLLLGVNSNLSLHTTASQHGHIGDLFEKVVPFLINREPDKRDGYILVISSQCYIEGFETAKIHLEFGARQHISFPYFTLTHYMAQMPDMRHFIYEGLVKQVSNSDNMHDERPERYNTTVKITSRSDRYKWLNINLEQQFTNEDFENGFEQMNMLNPFIQIMVGADWNLGKFTKVVRLFAREPDESSDDHWSTRLLKFIYANDDDEDDIEFILKVKKNLLEKMFIALSMDSVSRVLDIASSHDELASKLSLLFHNMTNQTTSEHIHDSNMYPHQEL